MTRRRPTRTSPAPARGSTARWTALRRVPRSGVAAATPRPRAPRCRVRRRAAPPHGLRGREASSARRRGQARRARGRRRGRARPRAAARARPAPRALRDDAPPPRRARDLESVPGARGESGAPLGCTHGARGARRSRSATEPRGPITRRRGGAPERSARAARRARSGRSPASARAPAAFLERHHAGDADRFREEVRRGELPFAVLEADPGTHAASARSMSPVTSGSHASPIVTAAVVCGSGHEQRGAVGARKLAPRRRTSSVMSRRSIAREVRTGMSTIAPQSKPAFVGAGDILGRDGEPRRPRPRGVWPVAPARRGCSSGPRGRGFRSRGRRGAARDDRLLRLQHSRRHDGAGRSSRRFRRRGRRSGRAPVEFLSSFAGSGTVTNQIIMGVPAELALLSLESDADRLAAAGVVPARELARASPRRRRQPNAVHHPRPPRQSEADPRLRGPGPSGHAGGAPGPPHVGRSGSGRSSRNTAPARGGRRGSRGRRDGCSPGSGGTSSRRPPRPARRERSSRTGSATRSSPTSRRRSGTGRAAASGPTSSILAARFSPSTPSS